MEECFYKHAGFISKWKDNLIKQRSYTRRMLLGMNVNLSMEESTWLIAKRHN